MWLSRKWQDWCQLNIDFLGISELKWTGYYGQESLRRNGVALIVNKRVQNAVLGCNLKNNRGISAPFQGELFNTIVIHIYAPTTDAKEAEVQWFYEDQQHLLELTHTYTHKDNIFIIGDWNAKAGSQEIPGITDKFVLGAQNEAGQRLTEFCEENKLVIANTIFPTTQEATLHMDITQMVNNKIRLIMFFAAEDGEALYSQQKQDL